MDTNTEAVVRANAAKGGMMRSGSAGRLGAVLVSAWTLFAAAAPAQAPAPVPPPGQTVVAEAVSLLDSGDAAARGAFLARVLAPTLQPADSARFDRLLAKLHDQGAPFEVIQATTDGRHAFAKLRSRRAARVLILQLSSDRADPAHLGNIDILVAYAAVLDSIAWPSGPLASTTEVAAVIRDNLERMTRSGAFSGSVLVSKGDSVVLAQGYGLANREDSVPNTVRTRYSLASMGKMFTATGILQLVQAGKLSLDDTLANVLPAYPNAERAERITIRQLLEHTAGLGDQWSTPKRPVAGLTGQLGTAAAVAHAPLLFEPGSRWSYSNEGYTVLGAVIEHLSGESYQQYLRRHILEPAGMTETVLLSGPDDIIARRAVGYRPGANDPLGVEAPRANWSFIGSDGAGGAGGGYSTVGDLARFGKALRDGVLLDGALRDSMWVGRWAIPGHGGERYGWGSFVSELDGHHVVGHGGGGTGSGMDNGFRHFTDGSYTVVVLTNIDPPVATDVTRAIVRLLAAQSAGTE